jgi:hypothetical protein
MTAKGYSSIFNNNDAVPWTHMYLNTSGKGILADRLWANVIGPTISTVRRDRWPTTAHVSGSESFESYIIMIQINKLWISYCIKYQMTYFKLYWLHLRWVIFPSADEVYFLRNKEFSTTI